MSDHLQFRPEKIYIGGRVGRCSIQLGNSGRVRQSDGLISPSADLSNVPKKSPFSMALQGSSEAKKRL